MIFGLDENIILESITSALEEAAVNVSEAQFIKIAEAVDNAMPGVIEVLTSGMAEHWRETARNDGGGWGSKYARAIRTKVEGTTGEIFVDEDAKDKESGKPLSMFVSMVENGMKSFSIKEGLLKSEKAKTSAAGVKYMIVPFPISTPRKERQGAMTNKFGGREMTAEMHEIVKSGGRIKSGSIMAGNRNIDVSGLTKYVTRQRHEGYGIFRVVSEKSTGWIHPGVGAQPVYPSVVQEVHRRVQEVLSAFCRELVQEYSKQ